MDARTFSPVSAAQAPQAAALPRADRSVAKPSGHPARPLPGLGPCIAGGALALGLVGDLLLHDGGGGVAFAIWIALVVLCGIALTWRAEEIVPAEASVWFGSAILFAAACAWRDSSALQFLDVIGCLVSLGLAAARLRNGYSAIFVARLRDFLWPAAHILRDIAAGFGALVRPLSARLDHEWFSSRVGHVGRVVVIAGVLIVLFGSLLVSADPVFASFVRLPSFNLSRLVSHGLLFGFLAWGTSGLVISSLALEKADAAPAGVPFRLGTLEVTTALLTLNLLFAGFVLAQLGLLFGGERFLQERTGLTAAQYARQGFFQMVLIVALVTPLLMTTRATLQPGRELARRHTMLATPIVLLLGLMIVSAVLRLRLYVAYYGLTEDRFYPLVFMVWLGVVLIWFASTILRDRGRYFIAGALLSAMATLVALNVVGPDRLIARVNLARVTPPVGLAAPRPLDVAYLSTLSGEAADLAVRALLDTPERNVDAGRRGEIDAARCTAATRLLARWGPTSRARASRESAAAWRWWNAGEMQALAVVGTNTPALWSVRQTACAASRRERRSRGDGQRNSPPA